MEKIFTSFFFTPPYRSAEDILYRLVATIQEKMFNYPWIPALTKGLVCLASTAPKGLLKTSRLRYCGDVALCQSVSPTALSKFTVFSFFPYFYGALSCADQCWRMVHFSRHKVLYQLQTTIRYTIATKIFALFSMLLASSTPPLAWRKLKAVFFISFLLLLSFIYRLHSFFYPFVLLEDTPVFS